MQDDPDPGKTTAVNAVVNKHIYASNNPESFVDPSGRADIFGWFVNAIAGLFQAVVALAAIVLAILAVDVALEIGGTLLGILIIAGAAYLVWKALPVFLNGLATFVTNFGHFIVEALVVGAVVVGTLLFGGKSDNPGKGSSNKPATQDPDNGAPTTTGQSLG